MHEPLNSILILILILTPKRSTQTKTVPTTTVFYTYVPTGGHTTHTHKTNYNVMLNTFDLYEPYLYAISSFHLWLSP